MIHTNINSNTVLSHHNAQNGLVPTVLVAEDGSNEKRLTEAQITRVNYYYAFEALTPLADWLEEPGRHWRVGGRRCWSVDEVIRAIVNRELLELAG